MGRVDWIDRANGIAWQFFVLCDVRVCNKENEVCMAGKIVRAYLKGGLGNQCFIYAAARAAVLRTGSELLLDGSYFKEDKVYRRSFSLDCFNYAGTKVADASRAERMFRKVRYALLRDRRQRLGNYCCDMRPFRYRPLPKDWCGTLVLDGYFQSERYFSDVREHILADFTLKDATWLESDPLANQIRTAEHSIFLHVRSYKEVPGKEDGRCAMWLVRYYRDALLRLEGELPSGRVFVFSDDIEWARVNVLAGIEGKSRLEFVFNGAGSSQERDFALMRLCRHGILADSSFSWWAGWLGEQECMQKGVKSLRLHVDKYVLNADFWPERWVAI